MQDSTTYMRDFATYIRDSTVPRNSSHVADFLPSDASHVAMKHLWCTNV